MRRARGVTYREYMDTPGHVLNLYLTDVLTELAATRDALGEDQELDPEPEGTGGWMDVPT